jgi:hypothetical protein
MKNKPNNIHIPYQLECERERERKKTYSKEAGIWVSQELHSQEAQDWA